MAEISAIITITLNLIKLFCSMIFLFLMLFAGEEKWNEIVRLVLAIIILILSIVIVIISISTGKILNVSINIGSIFIWLILTGMLISRVRDEY